MTTLTVGRSPLLSELINFKGAFQGDHVYVCAYELNTVFTLMFSQISDGPPRDLEAGQVWKLP